MKILNCFRFFNAIGEPKGKIIWQGPQIDFCARFISLLQSEEGFQAGSTPENSQVLGKLTFFFLTDYFISKHKKQPFLPNVLRCE